MNFKHFSRYFHFSKQQQVGIFILLIIIIGLQFFYLFSDFEVLDKEDVNKDSWISLQSEIDEAKTDNENKKETVYQFNPNFISDYKGYKLGMTVVQIDRLMKFRKENKYVNSADEFQKVTGISDSLLNKISPLFKFPNWTNQKGDFKSKQIDFVKKDFSKKEKLQVLDINQASQEDLMKLYGIGEGLSGRILRQKEALGCFVSMEQMKDIWGLSPEVINELNSHFKVVIPATLKKINVNDASLKELSQFFYFKYALAKSIITYRSMNGDFKNIEDLAKIKDFPVEKAKIISLYLEF